MPHWPRGSRGRGEIWGRMATCKDLLVEDELEMLLLGCHVHVRGLDVGGDLGSIQVAREGDIEHQVAQLIVRQVEILGTHTPSATPSGLR